MSFPILAFVILISLKYTYLYLFIYLVVIKKHLRIITLHVPICSRLYMALTRSCGCYLASVISVNHPRRHFLMPCHWTITWVSTFYIGKMRNFQLSWCIDSDPIGVFCCDMFYSEIKLRTILENLGITPPNEKSVVENMHWKLVFQNKHVVGFRFHKNAIAVIHFSFQGITIRQHICVFFEAAAS